LSEVSRLKIIKDEWQTQDEVREAKDSHFQLLVSLAVKIFLHFRLDVLPKLGLSYLFGFRCLFLSTPCLIQVAFVLVEIDQIRNAAVIEAEHVVIVENFLEENCLLFNDV